MGGKIWVESEADIGSTFYFTISLKLADEKSSLIDNSLSDSSVDKAIEILGGTHILVAEDNEFNQVLVKEILDTYGISVSIVENGQEAIDKLNHGEIFDGILMDCQMPVMDGFQATKKFVNRFNSSICLLLL